MLIKEIVIELLLSFDNDEKEMKLLNYKTSGLELHVFFLNQNVNNPF